MNAKIMAIMMVGVMMFSGLAITMGNEDNTLDAVVGDGGAYSYTITYHSDQMSNTAAQELQLTVADMTPISHASGTTTLSPVANEGSWGFNTTTGIGPFNSFYAAFDMTDGNKFVSVLDPYDLTKKIDGTSLGDMSDYNIMWVLPTVYWSVDNSGNLTLTNNPSAGTAYAHTIDGHVYNYIAIGVYEGSLKIIDGTQYLTSQSGVAPTSSNDLTTFRDKANNYVMDSSLGSNAHSMMWNFYQWELYKYCCFTVMEGFNSQNFVGNGHAYGSLYSFQTGSLNVGYGAYVGNPGLITDSTTGASYGSDSVKLFLENVWGGLVEWIDGIRYDGNNTPTIYIDTSSEPQSATTGDYVTSKEYTFQTGYPSAISMDASIWGMGTNTSGSGSVGLTDYSFNSTSEGRAVLVGGNSYPVNDRIPRIGVSFVNADSPSLSGSNVGSRLSFVMDNVFQSFDVNIVSSNEDYGSVSSSSILNVEPNSSIFISDLNNTHTLTIGETTVTATPSTATNQYTYSFVGWYDGSTLLEDGDTVTSDMTITATFSRTTNQYTVTASVSPEGYGTVTSAVTQPYGSAISASGNVLTIGSQIITATPITADAQYTYTFTGWSTFPSTLTENTSITANFDRTVNTYTITWSISGSTTSETLSYGEMPSHEDPVPPEGYLFAGWNPEIAAVTGNQTYTAVFEEIVYITVTFDPNGGQLEGSTTKTVGIGTPYGELPTPKKDNNKFVGWYTDPEEGTLVTADTIVPEDAGTTLYAHWELTGFAAMLKPLLFLFPLILLAFLAIALVRTFA